MAEPRRSSWVLLLLVPFLLSGAAALMAQMCWLRSLSVTMGGSSAALNIVLITYMGGLAIGARLAPALCRRTHRYLLFYAGLEGLLSVYLLFSPWLIAGLDAMFAYWLPALGHETFAAHAARLLVAGTALSLPTIAMGLTTPLLLTAAVERLRDTASLTGLLYGTNTLGAALGALLAGGFLILQVGLSQTLAYAAMLNATSALLALGIVFLGRNRPVATPESLREPEPLSSQERRQLSPYFALAAVGGFVAMALEVVFARFLVFMIGSSYYSFTISITGFLIGIVLGSVIIGVATRWTLPRDRILPVLFMLLGVTTLLSALLFEALPMTLQQNLVEGNPLGLHPLLIKLVAALILVLLPAMASGLVLPTLIHLVAQKTRNVTLAASGVLFSNTLGGVLGVALTGYLVIETIGVRNTLFALAIVALALSFYADRRLPDPGARWRRPVLGLAAAAGLVGLVLIPLRGPIPLITHSVIYHGYDRPEILFYDEDEGASVSVLDIGGGSQRVLHINGLSAAEVDGRLDYHAGATVDVAMASHADPKTVFVAGIGAGKSAGVAGLYPGIRVDAVEISQAVIDAMPFFDAFTYSLSRNETVKVIHGDARHYLRATDKRYDIILPDVFISALTGTAYLYNREFFELCAERLAPGGRVVMNVNPKIRIDRSMLAGFIAAFPYARLIQIPDSPVHYVIGANEEIRFPIRPWDEWSKDERLMARMHALHFTNHVGLQDFPSQSGVRLKNEYRDTPISTDDHPIVDFIFSTGASPLVF